MNSTPISSESAFSRRRFLGAAFAGTAATLAGAGSMSFLGTEPSRLPSRASLYPARSAPYFLTCSPPSIRAARISSARPKQTRPSRPACSARHLRFSPRWSKKAS